MEKCRLSVENDTIELKFLETLEKLKLLGPKVIMVIDGTSQSPYVRMAMLKVTIDFDFSGEEWDDNYNPKNG